MHALHGVNQTAQLIRIATKHLDKLARPALVIQVTQKIFNGSAAAAL